MTKLPSNIKARQLISALQRLGFKKTGSEGSHVRLENPNGKWTQVAVHPKPIPKGTLKAILRQTGLTVEKLIETLSLFL